VLVLGLVFKRARQNELGGHRTVQSVAGHSPRRITSLLAQELSFIVSLRIITVDVGFNHLYSIRITEFSRFCPSSGIPNTRKHDVSETGSVFFFRLREWGHLLCWAP
jgi:hypothetical protein